MFKTSREFEEAMYKILINIREGRIRKADFDFDIDDQDCTDAIAKAVDFDYVTGIQVVKGLSGFKSINARITYEGLKFVEEFEASQK